MLKGKDKLVDELTNEIEENVLPPDNIVVLNELRSASDLFRLMSDDNAIKIQPDFQREEVWSLDMRTRFVDSLSKEFPIPSMCFALDPKEQKYIVIDGLQRMSTIKKFLDDPTWTLAVLKDIDEKISGKNVTTIKKENPEIFRKIENISLPVTILRYDPTRSDNMEYIFTIFQRLNTFGERLNNQEIRNAIYQGVFNNFLKECAQNSIWRSVIQSQKTGRSNRMIAEERVLRFFAFYDNLNKYDGKLNTFLNNYMQVNRHKTDPGKNIVFLSVIEVIKKIGTGHVGKLSNVLKDSVLYGISKNLEFLKNKEGAYLNTLLKKLRDNEFFTVDALSSGIMKKSKVIDRLSISAKIFSGK